MPMERAYVYFASSMSSHMSEENFAIIYRKLEDYLQGLTGFSKKKEKTDFCFFLS
jgi:hypothetical protein